MSESEDGREVIVEFDDVRKSFGGKSVHNGVSLKIYAKEILALVGGSGQGKTVLLKELIGLLQPDSGRVRVCGQDVTQMSEEDLLGLRRQVTIVFQGSALFDSLNVRENVAYGLREHFHKMPEGEIRKTVAERLEMVDMPGTEELMPSELSGGMKKRVALARALALNPRVVLYDEPTTGLDPTNVKRINALIVRLREMMGVTSIMVTHDMSSVRAAADRIALLDEGRIISAGRWDEMEASADPRVKQFLEGGVE